MNILTSHWVTSAAIAFAAVGLISGAASVSERAANNAVAAADLVDRPPVKIEDLRITNHPTNPVHWKMTVLADAVGTWEVTYYKLGYAGSVCEGSGSSEYLVSDPVEYDWSHAVWTGDANCDRKIAETRPGEYVSAVLWTFTHLGRDGQPVTTELRDVRSFRVD